MVDDFLFAWIYRALLSGIQVKQVLRMQFNYFQRFSSAKVCYKVDKYVQSIYDYHIFKNVYGYTSI